jgi:hypothetical protein
MDHCFSEAMKSLLRGGSVSRQQPYEAIDTEMDGKPVDPNVVLLRAVLALPQKIHEQMETFEAGLAIGEIMAVLRLVRHPGFKKFCPYAGLITVETVSFL